MSKIRNRRSIYLMHCFETHPCVELNKLAVVERRIVDGEQLGAHAAGVEAVAHGDGAEEEAEAEERAVGDRERGARHSHGVQVQQGAPGPRQDGALGAAQLHARRLLGPGAGRRDTEEGAERAHADVQPLRARRRHDVGHCREDMSGTAWRGRRGHGRRGGQQQAGVEGRLGTSQLRRITLRILTFVILTWPRIYSLRAEM